MSSTNAPQTTAIMEREPQNRDHDPPAHPRPCVKETVFPPGERNTASTRRNSPRRNHGGRRKTTIDWRFTTAPPRNET